jgi:small subunit ribosomal protein S3Ae
MALQRTVDKWKMKRWFTVHAPKSFNEEKICEMPANDEKQVVNRKLKVSLEQLTHNPQNSFTNIVVKVIDVNGDAVHTKLVMIEQPNSYIRSLVRRYRSVATIVVPVTAKDGVKVVLKLVAITRERATHTRLRAIRKELTDFIGSYSKENGSDAIAAAVIEGRLQGEMAAKASHITPMSKVEVKKLEIAS